MTDNLDARLEAHIRRRMPGYVGAQVANPANISDGWESEVYAFDVTRPDADVPTERLVLRMFPGADAVAKSAREAAGIRLLNRLGYPAPQLYLHEPDASALGKPFLITEFVEGELLWPLLMRSDAARQGELLSLFCGLLVRLHDEPWEAHAEAVPEFARVYAISIEDRLARYFEIMRRFGMSGFEPVSAWLTERVSSIAPQRLALVHWDLHPANVLMRPDGTPSVIDWTQIEATDPRFDLAWSTVLFGAAEGWPWRDRILAEYERLSGKPVDDFEFFEAVACVKRLFSVVLSMTAGAEEIGMRPGAQAMMQRQLDRLQRVYALYLSYTKMPITEVENLFAVSST